jgi:hypothetical protein
MDTEEEIEKMAVKIAKDQGWTKIKALSMLQSRYESESRLEEAVIVKRILTGEESKPKEVNDGIYDES